MKRKIALLLSLILLASLTACGGRDAEPAAPEQELIEITLPDVLFAEDSEEDIRTEAKDLGAEKCIINDDGSVTYFLTPERQKTLLAELAAELDENVESLVSGEEAVPSFRRIDHNDDYSRFDIFLDSERYSPLDTFYSFMLCISGGYYQFFSGKDAQTADAKVRFVNAATKELIDTVSYRDLLHLGKEGGEPRPDAPTIGATVLLDHEGVRITAVEYVSDPYMGEGVRVRIENESGAAVGVGCKKLIVNDYLQQLAFFSALAEPGETRDEILYLPDTELEAAGIGEAGKLEVQLDLFDPESNVTGYVGDLTEIRTSAYGSEGDAEPTGTEICNGDGVRILARHVPEESGWGTSLLITVENDLELDVMAVIGEFTVNGKPINPWFYAEVPAGKKAVGYVTVLDAELKDNDIDQPESFTCAFNIAELESGMVLIMTDPVTVPAI